MLIPTTQRKECGSNKNSYHWFVLLRFRIDEYGYDEKRDHLFVNVGFWIYCAIQ